MRHAGHVVQSRGPKSASKSPFRAQMNFGIKVRFPNSTNQARAIGRESLSFYLSLSISLFQSLYFNLSGWFNRERIFAAILPIFLCYFLWNTRTRQACLGHMGAVFVFTECAPLVQSILLPYVKTVKSRRYRKLGFYGYKTNAVKL